MAAEISSNLRKAIWLMMTDRQFKSAVTSGQLGSALAKHGLQLTAGEQRSLSNVDSRDLASLLSKIEQDVSLMMGGSRPRTGVTLSDAAIKELKKALKDS